MRKGTALAVYGAYNFLASELKQEVLQCVISNYMHYRSRYPAPPTTDPPKTPLYDSLHTNIPHPSMCFPSYSFPPSTPLFPTAPVVLRYLESYATHFSLHQYIRLNTHITSTFWDSAAQLWRVKLSTGVEESYEFLVAANGHYRDPKYPDTKGLGAWIEKGKAKHSVYYRNPAAYAGSKKIVIVGGGPSAIDLVTDIRYSCPGIQVVVQSIAGAQGPGFWNYAPDAPDYRKKGKVERYGDLETGEVVFEDGTVETGVDFVFVATGYNITFPFLKEQLPQAESPSPASITIASPNPPLETPLFNSTRHVFPLARHLFPLNASFPPHVIAFPGLPHRIAPFPIFEDQARAIVRVIVDGPSAISIPDEKALLVSRLKRVAQLANEPDPAAASDSEDQELPDPFSESISHLWFRFGQHETFDYRKELRVFAEPSSTWEPYSWELELWDRRDSIRAEWKELVKQGEADKWVEGVGEKGGEEGMLEWVEVCRKLIKRYDERVGKEETKVAEAE